MAEAGLVPAKGQGRFLHRRARKEGVHGGTMHRGGNHVSPANPLLQDIKGGGSWGNQEFPHAQTMGSPMLR
jgi:hypothetical protein